MAGGTTSSYLYPQNDTTSGANVQSVMPVVASMMSSPQTAMQGMMVLMAAQQQDAQTGQYSDQQSYLTGASATAVQQRASAANAANSANSANAALEAKLKAAMDASAAADAERTRKIDEMKANTEAMAAKQAEEAAAAAAEAEKQTQILASQAAESEKSGKLSAMYDNMSSTTDANAAAADKRRKLATGRKATILTSGLGTTGTPSVGRKTLLGQ